MGFLDRIGLREPRDGFAVTAAATVLSADTDEDKTKIRRGAAGWQIEAWNAYDCHAEISYAATYQSNALSRIRLVPAVQVDPREPPVVLDPDGDDDLDLTPEERAAMTATISRLGAGEQSIAEIQRLLALNLFIAGDSFLVGYETPEGEVWDILSVEELVLSQTGHGYARRAGTDSITGSDSLPEDAFIARLYQRHPRRSGWAHSSMRSVLGLLEELGVLTDAIYSTARSRIPAGILMLSHNMRSGPTDETLTGQRDEGANDPTVQAFLEHMEAPIKNRRSASATTPFLMFGENADIRASKLIEFTRSIDQTMANQRAELIPRIATGINLPAEILTGKAEMSHWNLWWVGEDSFKNHLEPDAQQMVGALTSGYYRPHLAKMGVENVAKAWIWYDATPLTSRPNKAQDYKDGYANYEVSGEAYRRELGIADEDKPEPEEVAARLYRHALERITVNAAGFPSAVEIEAGLEGEGAEIEGAPRAVSNDAEPDAPVTNETTERGPARTSPPSVQASVPPIAALTASAAIGPLGPRLAQIERTLRLRLLSEASAAMERTLERAGNRLRSLANKSAPLRAKVQGVEPLAVAGTLGHEAVATLATSTEDVVTAAGFGGLEAKWNTLVRRAQEQALAGIDEHGQLDEADAQRIAAEMETQRGEGWSVLLAGLLGLAGRLLYEPNVEPPDEGEWADFKVPTNIVRDALKRAGGADDDDDDDDLLNGPTIHSALEDAGLEVVGYVWQTGDPDRPFEPHQALDGDAFESKDDPALENSDSWPDSSLYFPGDHDGCLCSWTEQIARSESEPSAPADPDDDDDE